MLTSTPVSTTTPASATAVPNHVRRPTAMPIRRLSRAAQTGWVHTSATDDATVVSPMLGTHVAK